MGSAIAFDATLALAGVRDDLLVSSERAAFDRDGYLILRDAVPRDWIEPLRDAFEGLIPAKWHFPRERGTRFSASRLSAVRVSYRGSWPRSHR